MPRSFTIQANSRHARHTAFYVLLGLSATMARAQHMGGPMRHILVGLDGPTIVLTRADNSDAPAPLLRYNESYSPPADVLNGKAYNAQFGWLADGFLDLPAGSAIWIELITQTPRLETYEAQTFRPLWTTNGSGTRWLWDGTMKHNWYATSACGSFQATYRVYVGDVLTGDPLAEYNPAQITLSWYAFPVGDLNEDFAVDLSDLAILLAHFGQDPATPSDGDLDTDGAVGLSDLAILLSTFGTTCP